MSGRGMGKINARIVKIVLARNRGDASYLKP